MLVVSFFMVLSAGAQEFVAPSRSSVSFTDSITTFTYKISDNSYKVYKSKNLSFYIWKTSKKTNKLYKYYLPKDIQEEMKKKYNEKKK